MDPNPHPATPTTPGNPAGTIPPLPLGRWAVVAALLLAAAMIFVWSKRRQQSRILEADTQHLSVLTVETIQPVARVITNGLALSAEVHPYVAASIRSRVNGYLRRWLVDLGAPVKAGEPLAEVDTPELDQELARARAQLRQTEAARDLAVITLARDEELLKSRFVSQQEVDEKKADLRLKEATVAAGLAEVRRLEEWKGFSRVAAPMAGVITARKVDSGDLVTAGLELFRLEQVDRLRIRVHVPQFLARTVLPGQAADLTFPEKPGRVYPATVVRTSQVIAQDSRTLLVELEADNPTGELLAGSFGQIRLRDAVPPSALTIPSNALLFRPEGSHVAIVRDGSRIELARVTLGRDLGPVVEIQSGVQAGDFIVINPPDSLVQGARVRLAERHDLQAGAPAGARP